MRLKKWTQAWKIRLIQEKPPRVDHRDAQWIPAFAGMTGETCVGGNPWLLCSFSVITLRHSRVGGNPWLLCSFSMITLRHSRVGGNIHALHVPRRRESIEYDSSSDVGWAKRSVPNTQMLPFPRFVKLLVRIAKLPSPMLPHPVFQVAGHACVERSLGFVGHDVDRRLFHARCSMDSRLRGNDGGGLRRRESMVAVLVLHDNYCVIPA